VVRGCIPRDDQRALALRVTRSGAEAVVELRALGPDHAYRNGLLPSVRIAEPEGGSVVVALQQIAPGQYAARRAIESGHARPYRFELVEGGGLTRLDVRDAGIQSLSYSWSDELRGTVPDVPTLRALGELTGGAYEASAEQIFAVRRDGDPAPRALWPYLLALALGLFLLDLLWRRAPSTWPVRRTGAA
jgi:hypothetical protein